MKKIFFLTGLLLTNLVTKSQTTPYRYMIVQTNENILDCPHFSNILGSEASNKFNIQLVEKNEPKKQIVFDISNYQGNLDSLKVNYEKYIQINHLPSRYFREVYFTNQITQ